MNKNITFSVKNETFNGWVITNPFMFGRAEVVEVTDNKTRKIVHRTVRIDENDELFFTWNGKTILLKEKFDKFECEVK